jgi:hypothetical protein
MLLRKGLAMEKVKFLTIFATFENLEVVCETLPSVVAETQANDAKLVVHDSSVVGRDAKWRYLQDLKSVGDFFLLLSDNLSMAHARNMCLHLGQELFAPDFILLMEDDHGLRPGAIATIISTMERYYGQVSPNGLRYGVFTACSKHAAKSQLLLPDGNSVPHPENDPAVLGKANSCFRCAPTSHWRNVLRGYDTDEYLISEFQTRNLNLRNYHKGFTAMVVQGGRLAFDVERTGRGFTETPGSRCWDRQYAASDSRSRFRGKPEIDRSLGGGQLTEDGAGAATTRTDEKP